MEVIPAMVEAVRRDGEHYIGSADVKLTPDDCGAITWPLTYWQAIWLAACQRADAKDRQLARALFVASHFNAGITNDADAWADAWDRTDPAHAQRQLWLRRANLFSRLMAQNTPRA